MEEREMLQLIHSFLSDRNFHATVESLEKETKFDLSRGLGPRPGGRSVPLQQLFDRFHEERLRDEFNRRTDENGRTRSEKKEQDEEILRKWNSKKSQNKGNQEEEKEEEEKDEEEEICVPNTCKATLENLHSLNPLVVRFNYDVYPPLLATGGADKLVNLADSETSDLIGSYPLHKAGVLTLDFHPILSNLLLSGSMDASHSLIDSSKDGQEAVLGQWKEHSKFVVKVKWSPNGNYFATGSYDKTSCLYSFDQATLQSTLLKKFSFPGAVEALTFTQDSKHLVLTSRDDNYLHYVSLPDLVDRKFNMNANGDNFVSFAVMDLAFHPNGSCLLAATDKSRIILFRTYSSDQILVIYGVVTDELAQPRLCWHPSGRFFFANQENSVCVVEIATQQVIYRLKGHTGIVRDLHYHPSKDLLVTASYDRTFKIWEWKAQGEQPQ